MKKSINFGHFTQEPVTMEVEEVSFMKDFDESEMSGLTDEEKELLIQTGFDALKQKVAEELIAKGYIKTATSEHDGKTMAVATIYVGKENTKQGGNVSFAGPKK